MRVSSQQEKRLTLWSSTCSTQSRKLDSWITWGVVGFVIGAALGVTTLSVWLVAIGLGAFIAYLVMHGPARRETEGALFASGGVFIVAWLLGFVARGLVL